MSSKFAKTFLTSTINAFYTEVETFLKSKNFENIPSVDEFLQFIEFQPEQKRAKRSTAAPTRGKVGAKDSDSKSDSPKNSDSKDTESKDSDANESNEPESKRGNSKRASPRDTDEKCTFVGARGGKCKSVAKKDCGGMCKKHFDQAAGASESLGEKTEKKASRAKSTVKTNKGLSSVVSKALDDSDKEDDEAETNVVQTRRTKPIDKDSKESKDSKDSKSDKESKTESKKSYVPITFNRDSTTFVYDEEADDGFVYKKGDYETVYAIRHRGVAVKPTRVQIEEIKKAGKSVGSIEENDR
jgi:hypothetical protein